MSKRLNARVRHIKTGFIYVSDAVLILAKAIVPAPFESELFESLYPFYIQVEVKRKAKVDVPARHYWRREDDGSYEVYWEPLDVNSAATEPLKKDWIRLHHSLNVLVKLVLEGHVAGRIEQPYHDLIILDAERAPRLRGQRLRAYCTSFLRLSKGNSYEIPALVSIDREALERAITNDLHLPDGSLPSISAQKRNWANGKARALTSDEKKRINTATERFARLAKDKFGSKPMPTFPMPAMVEFFAEASDLPTKYDEKRGPDQNMQRVSLRTIKIAISALPILSEFVARHGGPMENELAARHLFIEQLIGDEVFDKYRQILSKRKESAKKRDL